jgi:hypothetical protein
MNTLSATFFPFFIKDQIDALKVASIYFDEIYVLTPITLVSQKKMIKLHESASYPLTKYKKEFDLREADKSVLNSESLKTSVAFQEQAKSLIDAGIIHVVNPFDTLSGGGLQSEFGKLIELRARQLRDAADRTLHKQTRAKHAELLAGNVYVRHPPPRAKRAEMLAGNAYVGLPPRYVEPPPPEFYGTGLSHRGLSIARNSALRSVMYDAAILVSSKFSSIPLTMDNTSNREFIYQVAKGEPGLNKKELHRFERERIGLDITSEAIAENVPAFERIRFEDIIELRRHCEDELKSFRDVVRNLAVSISRSKITPDESIAISDIVLTDINPIVAQLERKIKLSKKQWAKDLLATSVRNLSIATFVSNFFIGIPLTFGLLIAAGEAGVETGIKAHLDAREARSSNGLSLLIRLREKTNN